MNKFKELFLNTSENIKGMVRKYPITIIFIGITTIFQSIAIDQDLLNRNTILKIFTFLALSIIGSLFTETYFTRTGKRIIGYAVSCMISFLFVYLWFEAGELFGIKERLVKDFTNRLGFTYIAVSLILTVYRLIKDSGLKFEEYMLKVFSKGFFSTLIYGIINIGCMLITVIFTELILNGDYDAYLFERIQILLLGFFYVPALLYCISGNKGKEVNVFIRALLMYVVLPLVIIAMFIIYIYIAKIIILQDIPSNMIYRILVGIFIVACPTWIMANNYIEKNKELGLIIKALPYLYMPFIILEIYSIGIRILEFGITPLRYVSSVFILFQIVILFCSSYKKREKLTTTLLIGSFLIFIVAISPLNLNAVSNMDQSRRLKKYLPEGISFSSLDEEKKDRVSSAYAYLNLDLNKDKYVPEYISEKTKREIEEYYNSMHYDEYRGERIVYVEYYDNLVDMDITQYRNMYEVMTLSYSELNSEVTLAKYDDTKKIRVNVEQIVKDMTDNYLKGEEIWEKYMSNNRIIKIDNITDYYITSIDFEYNKNDDSIRYFDTHGYILTK